MSSQLRLWLIVTAGLASDLLTKKWAVSHLMPAGPEARIPEVVIIPDYFRFVLAFNDGAVGGIFGGQTIFLVLISILALIFLFGLFIASRPGHWSCHIALGLMIGGALGNIYDRLFNGGKVVDFIDVNLHVRFFDPWPTFNVADMLLCVGVGLLMIHMFRQGNVSKDAAGKGTVQSKK
ncbi:MAG: signal peptidase II [Phycisphaerae bacterium]|nr:signal peptidase II [Phycisphaerae bacterium]